MTPDLDPVERPRITDRFTSGAQASWSERLGKLIRVVVLVLVILAGLAIGIVWAISPVIQ